MPQLHPEKIAQRLEQLTELSVALGHGLGGEGRDIGPLLQRIVLLANGRESLENPDFDPAPVVKLFTPDAGATWLLTEIDPDDHDHAFGLCDLGLGAPEIGWVSLGELATVRGRLGLPIERDLSFRAEKRLSAYARDARLVGRVVV